MDITGLYSLVGIANRLFQAVFFEGANLVKINNIFESINIREINSFSLHCFRAGKLHHLQHYAKPLLPMPGS